MSSRSTPLGSLVQNMLVQVFLLAILFRVALYFSGLIGPELFTNDSYQYDELAKSILHGRFAEGTPPVPSMNRTPGYPALLAGIYALFGPSGTAVLAVQILLDALTCVMVVHIGLILGLRRAAVWVVAFFALTCLHTASYAFQMMSETLYTLLIVASIWVVVVPDGGRADRSDWTTPVRAALSGLGFGLNILVRPAMGLGALLFVGAMFVFDLVKHRRFAIRLLRIPAAASIAVLVAVVPWMVRNYLTFPDVFADHTRTDAMLLGFKGSYPSYSHIYASRGYAKYLRSYDEPFFQMKPWEPPITARYVYPEEKEEVRAAYERLAADVKEIGRYRNESIPAFEAIADKRYAAAPWLYITAPLSKIVKVWVAPRASVLWASVSGYSLGLGANLVLTFYSTLYFVAGLLGIWFMRRSAPVVAIFIAVMIVFHTYVYAIWAPFVQGRYAVPMYPLFSLGAGFAVERWLARRRSRVDAVVAPSTPAEASGAD